MRSVCDISLVNYELRLAGSPKGSNGKGWQWEAEREFLRKEENTAQTVSHIGRYLNTFWYGGNSKSGVNVFGFLTAWAWGGGCEQDELEWVQERQEGGVETSLGLSGNLNGVETGLEATQQSHLNPARAVSYQEFREGTICPPK